MDNLNLGYKGSCTHPEASGKMQLSLVAFEDDGVCYVYCPALDLTGYGQNESEAKNSFEQTLQLYMNYTINKNTFFDDLKAHDWKIKPMQP